MEERTRGRRAVGRKEEKGKRKVAKENPEQVGRAARQDTLQLGAGKGETTHFYAFDEEQLPQRRTAHPSLFAFSDRHNQHAGVGLSTQVPGDCQTAVIFSGSTVQRESDRPAKDRSGEQARLNSIQCLKTVPNTKPRSDDGETGKDQPV